MPAGARLFHNLRDLRRGWSVSGHHHCETGAPLATRHPRLPPRSAGVSTA